MWTSLLVLLKLAKGPIIVPVMHCNDRHLRPVPTASQRRRPLKELNVRALDSALMLDKPSSSRSSTSFSICFCLDSPLFIEKLESSQIMPA